ncbi:DEAD/DEAH box helicase family protein [Vibrio sp. ZSDZ34]|uniref:DEAD/DEAH box helicase family protein n=1 Tax=Vibrio gelatinilyticus TaxID=2893468 RepID=A0A9X2AXD7_9VIBR|nr:DEAD/DEAH box helicase family protein [Vibrio gelatinilyticus]MCJ2375568.1 DEAD/DEAH box helicase family protein [Vibrio gelatinilyticus]
MLRQWQSDCVEAALDKYRSGGRNFFCQATPGAGKTVMAAELTKCLIQEDKIDLVLCFSPSSTVALGIKETFSRYLDCSFDGGMGAMGASYTYQSIRFLDDAFWNTIRKYRVLVVFDEIHHCSFDEEGRSNVWGEQILTKIQGLARYTLALSGTPWRSDSVPIAMAEYTDPDGKFLCDYQYGLKRAVQEKVCRAPKIVLVDSEHLSLTEGTEIKKFASILELIKQSNISYRSVIQNEAAMNYLLELGCRKLAEIRLCSPQAGGLIVAASVQHAKHIQSLLIQHFGQSACIVTYQHENPLEEIEAFRHSNTQWIVSVGMISEGTDVPRLQVCCHMSAVKTELYFRQVLGRILRVNTAPNQEAWLFTFAEESLIGFAERIEQDIPDTCTYLKQNTKELNHFTAEPKDNLSTTTGKNPFQTDRSQLNWRDLEVQPEGLSSLALSQEELKLGQFKQRVISAFFDRL